MMSSKRILRRYASFVPRAAKALNKFSADRKVRIAKIQMTNEKEIIESASNFLKERFNAQVEVYAEEDERRYDPKQRAIIAMPHNPAIYIE